MKADRLGNLAAEGDQGLEKTDRLTELSYREEAATPSASEKRSRKKGIPSDASFPTPAKSKRPVVYAATGKTLLPVTATSKSARAHAKSYTSGPPLVPGIIVASILQYVHKVKLRRMREYVEKICRYWSLKREARRGAPLLKRLYLEVSYHSPNSSGHLGLMRLHLFDSPGPRPINRKNRRTQRRLESSRYVTKCVKQPCRQPVNSNPGTVPYQGPQRPGTRSDARGTRSETGTRETPTGPHHQAVCRGIAFPL